MNPGKAYDCGKPEGRIIKMAWAGGEKKWPCAYQVIRAYSMNSAQIGQLVIASDIDGKKPEEVAKDWLDKNQDVWKKWTSCAAQ